MKQLWTEKYRPKDLSGYVFRDENQKAQIESWIKEGSIPHLLFSGSAGIGKTTLAKILCNELDVNEFDIMFANGSKEGRKIEWVDKLISFCQTIPFGPFKVVIIDEADYLNKDSVQPALRNLMEEYAATVRFILTCNLSHKIITPLRSRCCELHINKTDQTEFTARVATILVEEGVEFDLDTLDTYVKVAYPDLRKCINLVQQNYFVEGSGGVISLYDLFSMICKDAGYDMIVTLNGNNIIPKFINDIGCIIVECHCYRFILNITSNDVFSVIGI